MEKQLFGKLEIRKADNGLNLQIVRLYPFLESGEELTVDDIKEQIHANHNGIHLNEKLIEWYLQKAKASEVLFTNITIAAGKAPTPFNSQLLDFPLGELKENDLIYWEFVYNFFANVDETDLNSELPFKLYYVKKGSVIATQRMASTDTSGLSFSHEVIQADKHKPHRYTIGDNVLYDDAQKAYIATVSGYVCLNENKLKVIFPFLVSNDKLTLYFMNFERIPLAYLAKIDISTYIVRHKIDMSMANKDMVLEVPPGEPIVLVKGRQPAESFDASVEILVETETKQSPIDENGQINYREINQFPSVLKDELLARKKLKIKGADGANIFGNPILSRIPKDVLLKNGYNTYVKEIDNHFMIYSLEDGRIEYKNGMLSVFDQLKIAGDVDYSTGNINTKVNIHINGSVRTGFSIKSEKSVFIKGTVEDNCTIEAGGDIVINGGVSGKNNTISSQGNLSVKFIEGGNVFVKGLLTVHRFIMGAYVECMGTISVMGAGINLNERGAIIDSEIYVKNTLYCPTVGNDVGQKTYINLGFNKGLNAKIKNFEETMQKNRDSLNEINDQFEVDITSPNIHSLIKEFPREKKDKVIIAIQEKNKLDKQYNMISSIYEKELEIKKNEILNAAIFITNKVFPPLHLECENTRKIIDQIHPPSKYFYSFETKHIERDRFLLGKENAES